MKEFIISDESVNSYGFSILTSGIKLESFRKNPVMYYNHDRSAGVIGRWENIRVENRKLYATPVFDEKDELGSKIAGKVRDGFLRSASIGISHDETGLKNGNGVPVLTSCFLCECSICDIPSNKNAVMLYVGGNPVNNMKSYVKLNFFNNENMNKNDFKQVLIELGLSAESTPEEALEAVKLLKNTDSRTFIEEAVLQNFIEPHEKDSLIRLAASDGNTVSEYINARKERVLTLRKKESRELLEKAFKDGRIDCGPGIREGWASLFERDFETVKFLIGKIPVHHRISDHIIPGNSGYGGEYRTLKEYRKYAPQELRNNPALYQRLLEEERESKQRKDY